MVSNAIAVQVESLYPEINANHRECVKAGGEALQHAMQAGALLSKLKETLPHGEFQQAIEDRCDCSYETSRVYMKLASELPAILKKVGKKKVDGELTIRGGMKLIADNRPAPPERNKKTSAPVFSTPAKNKKLPSQSDQPSNGAPDKEPESAKGDAWEPEETTDTGKAVSEQVSTQRSKTVKTVEALMRAFDDLNSLLPSGAAHRAAIASCKSLLTTAKGWK